eukprot:scaffold184413_cov72-Cyclotella_meneghiniana.AAC.1
MSMSRLIVANHSPNSQLNQPHYYYTSDTKLQWWSIQALHQCATEFHINHSARPPPEPDPIEAYRVLWDINPFFSHNTICNVLAVSGDGVRSFGSTGSYQIELGHPHQPPPESDWILFVQRSASTHVYLCYYESSSQRLIQVRFRGRYVYTVVNVKLHNYLGTKLKLTITLSGILGMLMPESLPSLAADNVRYYLSASTSSSRVQLFDISNYRETKFRMEFGLPIMLLPWEQFNDVSIWVGSHIHPGVLSAFIYAQYSLAVNAWISLFTLQTQQEVAKLPLFKVRVEEALMPSADMSLLGKHCHFFGTQSDFQFGYLAPKSYLPPSSHPFDSSGSEVSSTVPLTCLIHDDNFYLLPDYNEQSCIAVMTREAGCMPQHAISSILVSLNPTTWPHPPYKLIFTSVSLTSTTSSQVSSDKAIIGMSLKVGNVISSYLVEWSRFNSQSHRNSAPALLRLSATKQIIFQSYLHTTLETPAYASLPLMIQSTESTNQLRMEFAFAAPIKLLSLKPTRMSILFDRLLDSPWLFNCTHGLPPSRLFTRTISMCYSTNVDKYAAVAMKEHLHINFEVHVNRPNDSNEVPDVSLREHVYSLAIIFTNDFHCALYISPMERLLNQYPPSWYHFYV